MGAYRQNPTTLPQAPFNFLSALRPSLLPAASTTYIDALSTYLDLQPSGTETRAHHDALSTYLDLQASGLERRAPFIFIFRFAPYGRWNAPYPYGRYAGAERPTYAIGKVWIGLVE